MSSKEELQRFAELIAAFVELTHDRDDVQLRGSTGPAPLAYAVRLQPQPRSAGAELVMWIGGASLSSWSANGAPPQEQEPRAVTLDFREGFLWECLRFPDARSLAEVLLHRLENEIVLGPRQVLSSGEDEQP